MMDMRRLNDELLLDPNWYFVDNSGKITLSSFINHKIRAKHAKRSGINLNALFYHIDLSGTINDIPDTYRNFVKENDHSYHIQFYSQSKYDLSPRLTVNAGFHAEYFALNNAFTIDPRWGLNWEFTRDQSISFGYGKHTQLEELKVYCINKTHSNKITFPDINLGFSHAQHIVLGYDWRINENMRLKVEPYYQYLCDIPGIPDSSYSMINFKQDWPFRDWPTIPKEEISASISHWSVFLPTIFTF